MVLSDKVCVITGSGSGIGEVTAKRFAEEGATVIVVDIDDKQANRVAEEINRMHGPESAYAIITDVSSDQEVRKLIEAIVERVGKIDVLFNNAAKILPKPLEEVEEDEWNSLLDVNLKSVYLMIKYAIPLLRRTGGNIINMSSLNGLVGQKKNAAYAATKGAIIAMTKALALDYAEDGVRVNCICPAGVITPLLEQWIKEQEDPESTRRILNDMHALGRPANAEEIADAALFLASGQSRFMTGVALPVDGGASLGY
ncbi:SDR family NAD(P)-dependent oxidoreductase [Cohnella lupini]|uniref:NAD(P)-dependent dehydrogenase (Short-subunit alcohol dehydrogenase family) n=1 Tax=Cohnella lupini TaxID=1294267 RepID=A0A3D9IN51_9BACL|nr:glucose 1-dehydrogenase [Cohnella lupini]RED63203.1 NAD(P)-dependent dehydrogenase (short-subunit alcohol dehydrogenase family) [Cohnella lupini]